MTKERIRIVMAECCGWADIKLYEDNHGPSFWSGYPPTVIGADKNNEWQAVKEEHHKPLPNYPDDLNAVHEAIKGFDLKTLMKFSDHLKAIVQDRLCIKSAVDARYMTLQAETLWWCEAFIRNLCPEKWEEDR